MSQAALRCWVCVVVSWGEKGAGEGAQARWGERAEATSASVHGADSRILRVFLSPRESDPHLKIE